MSPKSLKTIERLKELSEDPERLKRFVRAQDLAKQYNVWPSTIRRVAKRCGALCVVNDIASIVANMYIIGMTVNIAVKKRKSVSKKATWVVVWVTFGMIIDLKVRLIGLDVCSN